MLGMLEPIRTVLRALLKSERGATAVEYGIMVALIAVAIIGTVTVLGTTLSGLFGGVTDSL
jgi:pilus assembly protein Flp/PilA